MLISPTTKIAGVLILSLTIAAGAMRHQRDEARTALAELNAEVATATAAAQSQARAQEATLRAQTDQLKTALAKEKRNAKILQDRLVADVRAGTQRLSISARCPAAGEAATDSGPAPRAGPEGARAELDREAAETLIAIAADGDTAIRERNACFEAYEQVKQSLTPTD